MRPTNPRCLLLAEGYQDQIDQFLDTSALAIRSHKIRHILVFLRRERQLHHPRYNSSVNYKRQHPAFGYPLAPPLPVYSHLLLLSSRRIQTPSSEAMAKMENASKVDVALISDGEMPACAEVISKSFGHDAPFVDIYFPNHGTPSGQAQASKRLAAWKQSSESSTFLKAITRADEGSQEHIIGLAVWTLMKEAPPPELSKVEDVEEVWPDEDDREFMTRLWREYVVPRTRAIRDSEGKGVYGMWLSIALILICFINISK